MIKTAVNRVDQQPCYLLTSFPWKESSLWIEVFSKEFGRIPLLARSARKPQSTLRGIIMPFAPLTLSWYGRNELRTLHTAHWSGGLPQPYGKNMLSGFYINELLLKLTARDDPSPEIFTEYEKVVRTLCLNQPIYQTLRLFEWHLLSILGFTPDISQDDSGIAIDPNQIYLIQTEHAPQRYNAQYKPEDGVIVSGQSLIDLSASLIESGQTRSDILNLNRLLLDFRIPEGLSSRRVLNQLNNQTTG